MRRNEEAFKSVGDLRSFEEAYEPCCCHIQPYKEIGLTNYLLTIEYFE